jgi:hypothetical protein
MAWSSRLSPFWAFTWGVTVGAGHSASISRVNASAWLESDVVTLSAWVPDMLVTYWPLPQPSATTIPLPAALAGALDLIAAFGRGTVEIPRERRLTARWVSIQRSAVHI